MLTPVVKSETEKREEKYFEKMKNLVEKDDQKKHMFEYAPGKWCVDDPKNPYVAGLPTPPSSPVEKKKKKVVFRIKPIESDDEKEEIEEPSFDLEEELREIKNSNFQVKNQQFLLTYKTHLDKDLHKEFVEDLLDNNQCELVEYYICHENGKNDPVTPYEHSHVYFKCVPALRSYDVTIFDVPVDPDDEDSKYIHPNIKTVKKGLANEWNTKYYLTKEDQSPDLILLAETCRIACKMKKFHLGGGKSAAEDGGNLAERIWACESLREALKKHCHEPGWAAGIRTLWEEKQLKEVPKIPFRKACDWSWQLYLREKMLAPEWNHRLMHWIVGKLGAEGKTSFAHYFTNNYGGVYLSRCDNGKDIASLLDAHIKTGGSTKYIFIDLPRATKMHKMWSTLEALLNGKITVMKWKGATINLGEPRVIVFSNWSPPFDIEAIKESKELAKTNAKLLAKGKQSVPGFLVGEDDTLSHDRWEIGDILATNSMSENSGQGEPDRILTWRKNPFRTEFVKPTRFNHLPDDWY